MMKEETTTMENSIYGSRNISPSETLMYSDLLGGGGGGYVNQSSMFDNYMVNNGINEEELGFLEMLGVQEFQLPIGFRFEEMLEREMLLPCTTKTDQYHQHHQHHHQVASVNAPGTPNSSSISSASNNEGVAVESEHEKADEDDDEEEEEDEKDQEGSDKSKKLLKAKKANLKKQRQPRFAFMTKSEVDHLEDGYRWRKYGQKAVKNSPFPRSYYRCTSVSCGVKKRVERSCTDPSVVVTTYEGQHTHPSPLTPRGLSAAIFQDSRAFAATMPTLMQMNNLHSHYQHQQQQQQQQLLLQSSYFASHFNHNVNYPSTTNTTLTTLLSDQAPSFNSFTRSIHNVNVSNPNQGFIRDHGLLQDLIPSLVPKEESNVNL